MSKINERIAYLKGLSEGLGIGDDTKEGKAIIAIVSVIEDIVDELDIMNEDIEDLTQFVEDLDEDLEELEDDLEDLEEAVGDDDGVDFDDDDDFDFEDDDDEDEFDFEDEDAVYCEVRCPECGEEVCFDEEIIDSDDLIEVVCPECETVCYINDGTFSDAIIKHCDEDDGVEVKEESCCCCSANNDDE